MRLWRKRPSEAAEAERLPLSTLPLSSLVDVGQLPRPAGDAAPASKQAEPHRPKKRVTWSEAVAAAPPPTSAGDALAWSLHAVAAAAADAAAAAAQSAYEAASIEARVAVMAADARVTARGGRKPARHASAPF